MNLKANNNSEEANEKNFKAMMNEILNSSNPQIDMELDVEADCDCCCDGLDDGTFVYTIEELCRKIAKLKKRQKKEIELINAQYSYKIYSLRKTIEMINLS